MAEVCTDEALCETRAAGRSSLWYVLICDASKMASITGPHFGTARKPERDQRDEQRCTVKLWLTGRGPGG